MFEGWDAVVLARAQFAFTMSFQHRIPAFSDRACQLSRGLEALWLWTGARSSSTCQLLAEDLCRRLGMGVVSGIVMVLPVRHQLVGLLDKTAP